MSLVIGEANVQRPTFKLEQSDREKEKLRILRMARIGKRCGVAAPKVAVGWWQVDDGWWVAEKANFLTGGNGDN